MILDTNALSAFVDGDAGVGELLRRQPRAAIPVIVLGEFRHGIAESRHRRTYEAWLASELANFDVLAVTDETAIAYAALRVTDSHFNRARLSVEEPVGRVNRRFAVATGCSAR